MSSYFRQVIGEILAGDSFGELALLHNTRRRASIICKEDTEFLRLDKVDFNQVHFVNTSKTFSFIFKALYYVDLMTIVFHINMLYWKSSKQLQRKYLNKKFMNKLN